MEGLGMRGVNVGGALRQPSGGPTMNVKGTAAGGGNSLLIPMTEFSLGLTGDINDIMNAHNLAMVAMTSRMQHERNYNDEQLARLTGMRRLDIDPTRVEWAGSSTSAPRPCETSSSASAAATTASPCSPSSASPWVPSVWPSWR
jgi:formyltetrahydrofolate synthetase